MRARSVRPEISALKALVREGDEPKIVAAITGLSWDFTARHEINDYLAEISLDKNNSLNVRRQAIRAIDDPRVLSRIIAQDESPEIAGQARMGLAVHLD